MGHLVRIAFPDHPHRNCPIQKKDGQAWENRYYVTGNPKHSGWIFREGQQSSRHHKEVIHADIRPNDKTVARSIETDEKTGETGQAWLEQVKEHCPEVKFVAHYVLLGPYDFLDIYEAPDEEPAAKVSMISLSSGAFQAESWVAFPYKRFVSLTEEI